MLALSAIHLHILYQPFGAADEDYLSLGQRHKTHALTLDLNLTPESHTTSHTSTSPDAHLLTRNFLVMYKVAESLAAASDRPAMFSLIDTIRHTLRDQDHIYRDEQLQSLNWFVGSMVFSPVEEEETTAAPNRFPRFLKTLHLPISPYPDPEEVLDPVISDAYKEAIAALHNSWYLTQRPGYEVVGAIAWMVRMTDQFRTMLVVEKRQRALVILYFYCVMLSRLDRQQCWWTGKEQDAMAWISMMLDAKWMECIASAASL
ncbi:hypothetical protein VNI00_008597 [Paramarasmius palmivorus]|uniref:Uncharacterized protein n=1 Tax=Paramarasmius palmivorus TaxID=297713 RepID=A0AAW0CXD0_9AGAR